MRQKDRRASGRPDRITHVSKKFSENSTAMKRRNLLKTAVLLPAAFRPAKLLPQGRVYRPDFEPRNVEISSSTANHTLDGRPLPLSTAEENAAFRPMILGGRQRATLRRLANEIVPGSDAAGAPAFLEFLAASTPHPAQRQFLDGLDEVERSARQRYSRSFSELGPSDAGVLLAPLREPWSYQPPNPSVAFLRQLKSDLWRFAHTGEGARTYWYDVT